jgi:hypothetical protein
MVEPNPEPSAASPVRLRFPRFAGDAGRFRHWIRPSANQDQCVSAGARLGGDRAAEHNQPVLRGLLLAAQLLTLLACAGALRQVDDGFLEAL